MSDTDYEKARIGEVGEAGLEKRMAELEERVWNQNYGAPVGPAGNPVRPRPQPSESCCDDECEPAGCCALEFVFKRARVLSGQVGIDNTFDGETVTGLAGARSGMEVQFHLDVDGTGIIVPNYLSGFMQLTKQANKPGVWHEIDRTARIVYAPCNGKARLINYTLQAIEREVGFSEQALGKDEFGLVTGRVPVSCCGEPVEHRAEVTLHGGGDGMGTLEVIIEVRPRR
jgi:hypothetical protein